MTPQPRRPPATAVAAAPGPHLLAPVPIADVTIDDGFWAPRRRTWHEVTIPDCLESVDNQTPLPPLGIDPGAPLQASFAPDLLGGVALVRGPARAVADWGDALYRPAASGSAAQAAAFVAIPYFANSNRQPAEMMTWVRALGPPQTGGGAATR